MYHRNMLVKFSMRRCFEQAAPLGLQLREKKQVDLWESLHGSKPMQLKGVVYNFSYVRSIFERASCQFIYEQTCFERVLYIQVDIPEFHCFTMTSKITLCSLDACNARSWRDGASESQADCARWSKCTKSPQTREFEDSLPRFSQLA